MMMILIGIVFLLIGLGVTGWGCSTISRGKASASWPSVQGKVLSSMVSSHRSSSGSGRRSSMTYGADVSYEYTVKGKRYTSDRVIFGEYSSSNRGHATEIVHRYPKGKKVKVYYDPADHKAAVLEAGAGVGAYIPFLIGVVFTLVGGGVAAGGLVKKTRGGGPEDDM